METVTLAELMCDPLLTVAEAEWFDRVRRESGELLTADREPDDDDGEPEEGDGDE